MIVLDASIVVGLILELSSDASQEPKRRLGAMGDWMAAPHLLDVEVANTLRRYVLRGEIPSAVAVAALDDLPSYPIERYPHTPYLARAFELRDNATVYDALYLALAESLGAMLLTRDKALATVPGVAVEVEVIGRPM